MLSLAREKLIRSLKTKKGRKESSLLLVEGPKVIDAAGGAIDFTFTRDMTPIFDTLVTTETPQDVAAVAHIPEWKLNDVVEAETVVVLDGVQDPGNVGAALRLCLGFNASLILIESADVTSPKVVRTSVGALFQVPWVKVPREQAEGVIAKLNRPVFFIERREGAEPITAIKTNEPAVLVVGSEGSGILLDMPGTSVVIPHNGALESLNVGNALAIALYERFSA